MSSLLATGTGTGGAAPSKRGSITAAGFSLAPDEGSPVKLPAKTKKTKSGKRKSTKGVPVAVATDADNAGFGGPPPVHFATPGGFDVGACDRRGGVIAGVSADRMISFALRCAVPSEATFFPGSPSKSGGGGGFAETLMGMGMTEGGEGEGEAGPKHVREVCFNCWSRGQGAKCEMHLPAGERDRPVPPGQSVLVCGNWDVAAISRKYRSEEIQEVCLCVWCHRLPSGPTSMLPLLAHPFRRQVFAKTSSSLRYDKNRRQFVTVLESRHPLYRGLYDALAHHNERVRRMKRAKCWLRSIMEIVRVGLHGRGREHKVRRRDWFGSCAPCVDGVEGAGAAADAVERHA